MKTSELVNPVTVTKTPNPTPGAVFLGTRHDETVPRVTETKNPPNRGAIFQQHVAGVCGKPTGLKKITLPRNDDVVRQDTWQVASR